MVADNKGKKLKVAEKGEEDNNQIDEELILTIEKLQEIQDDLEKINEEASDKVLEVEQKYNEIRKPVYDKRNEIIKSIPDFWLTAFLSHPALGILLSEEDQKIFKFLSLLEVEDSKDVKSGYSITFVSLFSAPCMYSFARITDSTVFSFFFSWFSNTQPKGMIDDMQDEVAEIIKEDLWPNPLSYFNTDPDEEDFDGDEADEGLETIHKDDSSLGAALMTD
ncbi:hypothetical protein POTOM_060898 [Populus tomentosa]|uniref:NAP1-related protein 2 n=1 Tax=Populus tomentosa TaxID=118781 RepID=A0A8X8BVN8_POPTO|nr:hypothetical protein POTOM_060898 [Populus tomentosa]